MSNSSADALKLQEKRIQLRSRLNKWLSIQTVYIPIAQHIRRGSVGVTGSEENEDDGLVDENPEDIALLLPSELPDEWRSTGCFQGLAEKERALRLAQATDALEQVRGQLCTYQGLVHYKITQISGPGQNANARARNLLSRFKKSIQQTASRYRAARAALESLRGANDWMQYLKPLLDSDLRGPNGSLSNETTMLSQMSRGRLNPTDGLGEGRREISWIWKVGPRCRTAGGNTAQVRGGDEVDRCWY